MSLATDLTSNHTRLKESGQEASEMLRGVKRILPAEIYNELQLQLINIASETTKLGMNLGALRMIGELDQRPPEVTAERLELAEFAYKPPENRKDGPEMSYDPKPETGLTVAEWVENRVSIPTRLVPMLPHDPVHDKSALFRRGLAAIADDTLSGEGAP